MVTVVLLEIADLATAAVIAVCTLAHCLLEKRKILEV